MLHVLSLEIKTVPPMHCKHLCSVLGSTYCCLFWWKATEKRFRCNNSTDTVVAKEARTKTTLTFSAHLFRSLSLSYACGLIRLALDTTIPAKKNKEKNPPVIAVRVGAATVAVVGIAGGGEINLCASRTRDARASGTGDRTRPTQQCQHTCVSSQRTCVSSQRTCVSSQVSASVAALGWSLH